MKKQDWLDIEHDCPLTTEECRSFFMQQYLESWDQLKVNRELLLHFLKAKGFIIEIKKQQKQWKYQLWLDGFLVHCEDEHAKLDLAYLSAIKEAFLELER